MNRFLIQAQLFVGGLLFGYAWQAGSDLLGLVALACFTGAFLVGLDRLQAFLHRIGDQR